MNGRIEMMGCLIDNLSMEETLQRSKASSGPAVPTSTWR